MINIVATVAPPKTTGAILDWFLDMVRKALASADISKMTKEEFLAAVDAAYDQFVLPLDLPGPDIILDPLLKQVAKSIAGRAYDTLFQQQVGIT